MGKQVPEGQLRHLLGAFVSRLQQAKPQEVSNTQWGVATMGQQLPQKHLQQLLNALVSMLQQATMQATSNTLWAVATMGRQVPEGQLQQLLDAFASMLQQGTPQAVATVEHPVGLCQARLPATAAAGSAQTGRAAGNRHPSELGQCSLGWW
jgi:hypothetical protein